MIRQSNDVISNTVDLIADNLDISFKAKIAPLSGKCEEISVKIQDRETNKMNYNVYTGKEAELVFDMLAKPAMKLGYIVHREG